MWHPFNKGTNCPHKKVLLRSPKTLSMCVQKAKTHRKSFVLRNTSKRVDSHLLPKVVSLSLKLTLVGQRLLYLFENYFTEQPQGLLTEKFFRNLNEWTFSFITTWISTHLTPMKLRLVKKDIICTGNPFQSHHSNRQITKNTALQYNLALQYVVWLIIGKETSEKRWITLPIITPGSILFTLAMFLLIYWISSAALPEVSSIFCPLKGVFTSWGSKDRGCWMLYELWRSLRQIMICDVRLWRKNWLGDIAIIWYEH